jgi:protein-ribulosamine 3-kinase
MLSEVPSSLLAQLKMSLPGLLGNDFYIKDFSFASGGCINHGGKLETSKGPFFIKWNDAAQFPSMFEAEVKGLAMLKKVKVIHIPEVIVRGEAGTFQYLVLAYTNGAVRNKKFSSELGEAVAWIHKVSSEEFGLDHSNYIGSLKQFNVQTKSWIDFFIEQRLQRQVEFLEKNSNFFYKLKIDFESLYQKLPGLLHQEKPSLVHGDLWSGNVMVNENGSPSLIDPAIYFGNREVDLGMTHLFGGFSKEFYESYQAIFPLENDYETRFEIYNLYPLLVHVNLFGGGYLQQVQRILKKFI